MSKSYFFNSSRKTIPGALNLIAVPRWLELAIKAKNVTIEQALAQGNDAGFGCFSLDGFSRDIVSESEVLLHDQVTWALQSFLFPHREERAQREELYAKLINLWHAVPMVKGLELNLHPIILGENLIGLYHVEAQEGVTDTDLYGRILRCAHTLAYNKIGVKAFGGDLVKDVLYEISVGQ